MKYGFYPGCAYHSSAGYKESVEAVNRKLGIEFSEISDWNCCGATVFWGMDRMKALALTGRNIALAQKQGHTEIVTGCNACYSTLRKANESFIKNTEYRDRVNQRLAAEGLKIEGTVKVRHILEILAEDVPEDVWTQDRPPFIQDISVASYYGCQLTRPWGDIDHPERPIIMDRFIERMGFSLVLHSASTLCCGASHAVPYKNECRPLISRIVQEVHSKGADLVAAICPLCQFNLDDGQKGFGKHKIPVPYITQLAGLALGINQEDLGLNKLLISTKGILYQFK